jgi:hypothetical protein
MTTTLTTLEERLRSLLMDAGSAVWDAAALAEAIRLALGEYALAGKVPVSLAGLDGATETTLNPLHDAAIVWGAAAYAALARAVDRAESFTLGSRAADLKAWGDQRLSEFKAMLGALFPGYLIAASGGAGADPAKTAAEIALLGARTTALSGDETRAAAAAVREEQKRASEAQERADEAARLAGLRNTNNPAWGAWADDAPSLDGVITGG